MENLLFLPRKKLYRLVLAIVSLIFIAACSTQGCQGCSPMVIPGGFPAEKKFANAMQVRLSQSGISFIEQNITTLSDVLFPGGSMAIPSSCNSDPKICCGTTCTVVVRPQSLDLNPVSPNTLKVNLRTTFQTSKLRIKYQGFECDVQYNSVRSSPQDLGLTAELVFNLDSAAGKKLTLQSQNATVQDFSSSDIDISGTGGLSDLYCKLGDNLKGLFEGFIKQAVVSMIDTTLTSIFNELPLGQEARVQLEDVLASFSPRTTGTLDYFIWSGGYADAEQEGMSLGTLAGFRAAEHHPCVPDCEGPAAPCQAPAQPAIPRSQIFRANVRPQDSAPFDVGIGIDHRTLDTASYAFWRSGGTCLDITSQTFDQLSSDIFTIIIPSIKGLTNGQTVPMMVSVRPRTPPTVAFGAGTYHQDDQGKILIDDPLLTLSGKDFAVDIYAQLDERMVRLFTIVGDLSVPALLTADTAGRLIPVLGSLDQAFTNVRLENADLITEDTESLAKLFPTVLNLAAGFLAAGFEPIELPSIKSLKLVLDEGSITTVENNQVLAIFAKLGIIQTTGFSLPPPSSLETWATLEQAHIPPTSGFQIGPDFDPQQGPSFTIRLGATTPAGLSPEQVEFTYRIDRGFYHPWRTGTRTLQVQSPLFWLQGHHLVEIAARIKGRPQTMDPSPAVIPLTIDTIPPQLALSVTLQGVQASVDDGFMPANEVQLSWSINGGPWSDFAASRTISTPAGATVRARARDRAGNISTMATILSGIPAQADATRPLAEGGCSIGHGSSGQLNIMVVLALVFLFGLVPVRLGHQNKKTIVRFISPAS